LEFSFCISGSFHLIVWYFPHASIGANSLTGICKRAANQNILYRTIRDDTGQHQTELQPVQDSTNSTVLANR